MMHRLSIAFALGALVLGCHEGGEEAATPDAMVGPALDMTPVGDRALPPPDAGPMADAAPDAAPDLGPRPAPGTRVEVDLTEALALRPDAPGAGPARAFVSLTADDLVDGPTPLSRVGDYVLENARVRFVVEAADRAIGPCPYGGNVIDADIRRPDGEPGGDNVGEICLLMNLGQTLLPETYEILADGADGGAAVLAVTGSATLLDFINLRGLVATFLGDQGLSIGYDIDRDLPLTITAYYVLRPGDTGVRVITALRNDGDETLHLPVGHLVDSGGAVEVLNPLSPTGGFGNGGFGADALGGVPLTWVAFGGANGGHAYVPLPDPDIDDDYPSSGRYLWVAGVVASLVGADALLPVLLALPNQIPNLPGLMHLEPRDVQHLTHWHFVGDGSPHTVVDPAWEALGVETGVVQGEIRVDGQPDAAAGIRLSAIDGEGRAVNQVGDAARYAMRVPPGEYTLRPWKRGYVPLGPLPTVTVAAGETTEAPPIDVQSPGRLAVAIRRPDGSATPGRVFVQCVDGCPQFPDATQRDVDTNGPLDGIPALEFTGVDGLADIALAPGRYRVVVSRGPGWSVWPPDAVPDGGREVEIVAGEAVALDAEIAPVIDRGGWLSGDFHVHGINSPDAPITLEDRVRSFLGEGVDVLVSTDHDSITDYRPTIAGLGAEDELIGVVGIELTTFDYGHYNSFPLVVDPESRNGGAVDWAGGTGPGLTPDEIFRALEDHSPGERVIQINHPDRGGIGALDVDLLRGFSRTPAELFRLPPTEPDPVTGDTGLWSERFTALEIMNGNGSGSFNGRMRWWLTLVGRGFTPTATAVSDTHRTITTQSGSPRSYVDVGAGADTPEAFDGPRFTAAVNAGRLFGSNGPFVDFSLRAGEATAGLGDTLRSEPGAPVEVRVDVQTPAWMAVDRLELFVNITDALLPDPDPFDETAIPPTHTVPLVEGAPEPVAQGAEAHGRRRFSGTFELRPEVDSYVVGVVRGSDHMYPVLLSTGVRPMAYTNPIYIDVDGGGYDRFPLADAAAAAPKKARRTRPARRRMITLGEAARLFEWLAEGHDGH